MTTAAVQTLLLAHENGSGNFGKFVELRSINFKMSAVNKLYVLRQLSLFPNINA